MASPRIIAGSAKGIRLKSVPGFVTRPITDRAKEALFNIIGPDVINSKWLDLFAGTGSVGLEALSRGAEFVRFIEINHSVVRVLKENIIKCGFDLKSELIKNLCATGGKCASASRCSAMGGGKSGPASGAL